MESTDGISKKVAQQTGRADVLWLESEMSSGEDI